jgi:hypothetical protein
LKVKLKNQLYTLFKLKLITAAMGDSGYGGDGGFSSEGGDGGFSSDIGGGGFSSNTMNHAGYSNGGTTWERTMVH